MKITNVTKYYGSLILFENVRVVINRCGLYLIHGESGAGKSTLLNIIAGYEKANKGDIDLEGCSIAYSLQNQRMIEEMDVHANLCLYDTLYSRETSGKQKEVIEALGISDLMHHYPSELSRGQRQRLSVAQTLLSGCDILLFDEPTEYLDKVNRQIVMRLLKQEANNKVIILTSHEKELILQYDPVCYVIKNHNVALQKEETSKQSDTMTKHSNSLNLEALIHSIELIIKTSCKNLYRQLLFLLIVLLFVFQLFSTMFLNVVHYQTYQSDIYMAQMDENSELSLMHISELEPILQFRPLHKNGEYIVLNVIPFYESMRKMQNELEFIGEKVPVHDGIIINQNFCRFLADVEDNKNGNCLGEQLILGTRMKDVTILIPFVISGIVNEPDALHVVQGYYDMEYVQEYLNEKGIYEYWQKDCKLYMIRDHTIIPTLKKNYSSKSLYIGNKVEDAHSYESGRLDTYRFGFQFALLLIFVLFIGYLSFLLYTYWNHIKGSLSVLAMVVRRLPLMIKTHMHLIAYESGRLILISLLEIIISFLLMDLCQITLPIYCYVSMVFLPFAIVCFIHITIWSAMHLLKTSRLSKFLRLGDEEI